MSKTIEIVLSAKLTDQWLERIIPFVYSKEEVLGPDEVARPVSFQRYEKLWVFNPCPPSLQENVVEIGIVIIPAWVNNVPNILEVKSTHRQYYTKQGFEWRAFIPYHAHHSCHTGTYGLSESLEQAMSDSENWIANCLKI